MNTFPLDESCDRRTYLVIRHTGSWEVGMEDEAYPKVKIHVEDQKGFTSHLGVFIFVNAHPS
jgi:hypothetical protein